MPNLTTGERRTLAALAIAMHDAGEGEISPETGTFSVDR